MSKHDDLGMAFATFVMTCSLLKTLKKKGVLTDDDTSELLDSALLQLEKFPIQSEATLGARKIVETALKTL